MPHPLSAGSTRNEHGAQTDRPAAPSGGRPGPDGGDPPAARAPADQSGTVRIGHARGRPTRVAIADHHPASRFGIRLAVERAGFIVVAECATGGDATALVAALRPDVCLVDADIPGGGGIVAARAISLCAPQTAVVLLSATVDEDDVVAAIVAGASGYVPRTIAPERLPVVLRGVLAGEPAIPRAMGRRVLEEIRRCSNGTAAPDARERDTGLTPRESQVTRLMQAGMSTREIAARLGISEVTVRRHVSAALRKLEVPDRQTAVRMFRWNPSGRRSVR